MQVMGDRLPRTQRSVDDSRLLVPARQRTARLAVITTASLESLTGEMRQRGSPRRLRCIALSLNYKLFWVSLRLTTDSPAPPIRPYLKLIYRRGSAAGGLVEFNWGVCGLGTQGELVQARDRQRAAPWTSMEANAAELLSDQSKSSFPFVSAGRVCIWIAETGAANGLCPLLLPDPRPYMPPGEGKDASRRDETLSLRPIVGSGRGKGSEGRQ